ncbi:hypothetical protein DERP_007151 [Dermatophagoides pteronyssinus]|uniref:Uncharacterized protein n=1 Tax=Dermatophagoides pteronyssinus TaxID=6956 RepID=A0ABQ8JUE3_DERPT|nr:hypothetical protein DERP_007151 [Dermatophagoides pteronyssinus]
MNKYPVSVEFRPKIHDMDDHFLNPNEMLNIIIGALSRIFDVHVRDALTVSLSDDDDGNGLRPSPIST